MAALDATVIVLGPDGERSIPMSEFHRLPGAHPERDTTLRHGELIIAVEIPALEFSRRSTYRKVRDRASYAFALVSVAAALDVADGTVRDARIALGGVAHKPWATRAEEVLRGSPATEDSFRAAADAELETAEALSSNGFKVPMARGAIVAVLRELSEEQR